MEVTHATKYARTNVKTRDKQPQSAYPTSVCLWWLLMVETHNSGKSSCPWWPDFPSAVVGGRECHVVTSSRGGQEVHKDRQYDR
jgi:hypothetical protein